MAKKTMPPEASMLLEWQDRLGLRDWTIVLETNCTPREMDLPESEGCTSWEESTKTAKIQIADPTKLENLVRAFDFEEILVHELMHIKTTLLSKSDAEDLSDRILHQLIDDMARALVNARRAPYEAETPAEQDK